MADLELLKKVMADESWMSFGQLGVKVIYYGSGRGLGELFK